MKWEQLYETIQLCINYLGEYFKLYNSLKNYSHKIGILIPYNSLQTEILLNEIIIDNIHFGINYLD